MPKYSPSNQSTHFILIRFFDRNRYTQPTFSYPTKQTHSISHRITLYQSTSSICQESSSHGRRCVRLARPRPSRGRGPPRACGGRVPRGARGARTSRGIRLTGCRRRGAHAPARARADSWRRVSLVAPPGGLRASRKSRESRGCRPNG